MADLKLARLPDRTPVRLTIAISPELKRALDDYAAVYRETYGQDEPVADLVPAMLGLFLASDRAFAKAREAMPER
jgi:hypothetical protein